MPAGYAPAAAGLDGCRGGWVAAIAVRDGRGRARTGLQLFETAADVIAWRDQQTTAPPVGIDMPIGLPAVSFARACDLAARARLGRRWMCVFEPPDRALFGLDFGAARELIRARRRAHPERAFHIPTHQTINITPKVREIDLLLTADPDRQHWLIEVHPELSFRTLAGHDLRPKRMVEGRAQRLALLRAVFPDVGRRVNAMPWLRRVVAVDDALDAYAALWSASRFAAGTHEELGDGARDGHGLLQRLVV